MTNPTNDEITFDSLNLPATLLKSIKHVGYEKPSPIQAATIPLILSGRDIIGMAQTGTGKTAAFALPVLSNIDIKKKYPQALVLCPTRELAIQVAEAFQTYANGMKGFHVLPIYGGQDMRAQLRGIQRGVHVIVATPGRLLDHIQRKSIDLSKLEVLVLDEADEMLRMGFIDDVETILQKTPESRQVALFSATMPGPIKKVAKKYLTDPAEVRIETKVTTNENIEQSYWLVSGTNKLEALTRILEIESFDGMIIFVRTKTATTELSDKLNARGFSASALNGDINQTQRQRTVEQLKRGKLDILIATDVAARGLDVERISHVINYDIPYDDEAYVHRIGRTGRAGRTGKAILFVTPRERHLLRSIEKTTRKKIAPIALPSRDELIDKRSSMLKKQVSESLELKDPTLFKNLIAEICSENNVSSEEVAASLLFMLQKDRPLVPPPEKKVREERGDRPRYDKGSKGDRNRGRKKDNFNNTRGQGQMRPVDQGKERYRIEVGRSDNVKPGEIVGAIANEANINGKDIGHIKIFDDFTTVDLPSGMAKQTHSILQKTRIRHKPIRLSKFDGLKASKEGTKKEKERNQETPKTKKSAKTKV